MNKIEARQKMLAAFDDIAKGAIALVLTAVITRAVDNGYDKLVVARRKTNLIEVTDA